jgi:hypothetical protein
LRDVNELRSDFIFSTATDTINICACATQTVYFTITNTGLQTDTFGITAEGITFAAPQVILEPGQSHVFTGYLSADCKVTRSSDITIRAASAAGIEKVISLSINPTDCQNTVVAIQSGDVVTNVCETAESSLLVQNTGSFPETYVIYADPSSAVRLAASSVTLQPGLQTQVPINYAFDCSTHGNQTVTFTVEAQNSGREATVSQNVAINYNYNYSISTNNLQLCSEDDSSHSLLIENHNNFANKFLLELDGPSFVSLANESIVLGPQEEESIPLVISASNKAGNYTLDIYVESVYGEFGKKLSFNLTLDNCYDFSQEYNLDRKYTVCAGEEFYQEIKLAQEGTVNADVNLFIDGPDFIYTDELVTAYPQTNVYAVSGTIPLGVQEKYSIDVETLWRGDIVSEDSFKLQVLNQSTCYAVEDELMSTNSYYTAEYVIVPVEQDGSSYAVYDINYENLPDYLEPLTYQIDLGPSEEKELAFEIDSNELEYVARTQNNGAIIGIQDNFSVVLTEQTTGFQSVTPHTVSFIDYPWYQKTLVTITTFADNTWQKYVSLPVCVIGCSIVVLLILLLGFVGILQATIQKRIFHLRKTLALVLGILWIVILALALFQFGLPLQEELYTVHELTQSSTYMQLNEDKTTLVNVTGLFSDPDNDIVRYGVYAIDQGLFTYDVDEEGVLSLTPAKDWYGSSHMQLFATDSYNETAVSDRIILEVLPVEDYSFIQLLFAFCEYIFVVLLAILFIVFCAVASLRPRHKEKQKKLTDIK